MENFACVRRWAKCSGGGGDVESMNTWSPLMQITTLEELNYNIKWSKHGTEPSQKTCFLINSRGRGLLAVQVGELLETSPISSLEIISIIPILPLFALDI